MTTAKTLRRREEDVRTFLERFVRLVEVLEPHHPTFGGYASWAPQQRGREAEAARLGYELDEVAGRAAYALNSVGSVIAWKPRGYPPGYSQPVNPATAWRAILDDDPIVTVDLIIACCQQAIGVLDGRATDAEEHASSFTGKLEGLGGFWRRIRGDRERGVPSQYGAIILGSVLTLATTLAGAYLVNRFGWLPE